MAFSKGTTSVTMQELKDNISDTEIASYYFNIKALPCVILSPLREEQHPSFGLYINKSGRIYWVDFATKERGDLFSLLSKMWNCTIKKVIERIYKDFNKFYNNSIITSYTKVKKVANVKTKSKTELTCKVRKWEKHDVEYWESYGVSLKWLKYAEVYPISHKIFIKNNTKYVLHTDKYAYAFIERKEGNITIKIYQPFNNSGYKWSNKHDRSVISLWTKVPTFGEKLVICSSLKDALCFWSNTGIPAIATQGEGYTISNTAISELKRRYKDIYILFDNDEAGLNDGEKLSKQTGFKNIILPPFLGGKDVSDLYKVKGKKEFLKIILNLFN